LTITYPEYRTVAAICPTSRCSAVQVTSRSPTSTELSASVWRTIRGTLVSQIQASGSFSERNPCWSK